MAEGDVALACEPSARQEERPYKCKQCPRSYRHAGSLVNHRRTHEVGLFPCLLCRKDFSNPMALKSHLRTHAEEKRHKCRDCGRSFRASSQLSSHHCTAHATRGQEEEEEGSNSGGCTSQRGQDNSSSDADTCSGAEGGGSLLTNLEKYIADSVVPADFSLLELSIKRDAGKEVEKEAGLRDATPEERRFKCNQCDKAYKHAGSLTNHKQSHTLGTYQCSMCYKEFSNLMALKSHTRLHSEYRPYKCRFCHKAFRLPSELLSHQKAHDEEKAGAAGQPTWDGSEHSVWEEDSIETSAKLDIYQPPPAGTNFRDSAPCSLKDASKAGGGERCSPDGELCIRCGGTFASEEELKGHSCLYPEEANEEEGGGGTPSQLAPGSNGIWEASLKGEEDYHTLEERPFRCEDCGRTYRHAGSLINHKKSHQIGVYSCSVCSKQLYNLAALKNHLRVHLKAKLGLAAPEEASQHPSVVSDMPQEEDSPVEPGDGRVQPPDIWGGASCFTKEEEERGVGEEERPYRCGDCGRSYRHRGSLVNHRHTHQTGVFQCSICPKQYTNLMALRNHVRVHLRAARLSGREPVDCLTCPSCGESFEEEAEFQLHQLRHLPCSEDIEAAAVPGLGGFHPQEADLLQAIKQDVEALENGAAVAEDILPSSEAPHACDQRGATFAGAASLQNHSLQHGGSREQPDGAAERPESPAPTQRLYSCDLCGKSYRHSGSLINHKQTHQTGDFSCSVCGKHFQNVASLKSHLRGHQRPRRAHSGTAAMANADEDAEAGEGAALPGMPPSGEEFKDSYDLLEDGARVNGWPLRPDLPSPPPGNGEVPPYLCEQCGAGFNQASSLESHKETHQLGIYQCSLCPKEYPSLLALRNHFHGHAKATASSPHGNDGAEEQPFLCSLCGMIFPSGEELQHHHHLAHEEGGAEGEEVELKAVSSAQGEDAEDPGEEQLLSHICGYCGETFDDMASLEEHSEGHQEEKAAALADTSIQLRRAPRVEEEPTRLSPVEIPVAEPLDDRPYACSQCGKTYRHGGSLVNHKKIHQIGDYQCGICCRQYPNLSAYRNHLRNHPKCKLNGSVPEIRQPVPVREEGPDPGGQKDEPPDGQVLVHEGGKDPPGEPSSSSSPGGEQRWGREAALHCCQPETQKTLAGDICKEESEEKAALEAQRGCHLAEVKQEEEEEDTSAKEEEAAPAGGEGDVSPGAEEGSPSERPFRCEVCGRSYKHAGSLINHKQTHKTGLFHCSVCQKQFFNLMALKNHQRTHFETKRHRCPECPKAFRLQKQLASHERVHRDRRRDPSSHPSRRAPHGRRVGKGENAAHPLHAAKHRRPDPEERPYQCGECGRTYRHAGSLLNHQKSHRTGHFSCPLCSKAYPNLMSLKNHQRIHYEVKRHQCLDCGKAFKWQRQLVRHQRRLHASGSGCSVPGQEHERSQQQHGVPEKERGGSPGELPPGPFRCLLCSKQFPSRTSLRNHARVHAKKRFECSECGKAYRASRDLARHLRRHRVEAEAKEAEGSSSSCSSPGHPNTGVPPEEEERPYKCDSCDRTYRHAGSLLNHQKAHATGLYRCPTCQKEFYNLLALKSHLHTHRDKKRHRCPHCGKAFRTARRLAAHARVHGGPKEEGASSACPVGPKVFFRPLNLQQPQLAHARDGGHSAAGGVPTRDGS